eukprot:361167-Amorphochlora_amoeboformis.AAC.1
MVDVGGKLLSYGADGKIYDSGNRRFHPKFGFDEDEEHVINFDLRFSPSLALFPPTSHSLYLFLTLPLFSSLHSQALFFVPPLSPIPLPCSRLGGGFD